MTTAIRFDRVSKRFILRQERPRSFQDLVIQFFRSNGSSPRKDHHLAAGVESRQDREEFWALQDVSFEVEQGENVGIIGPNGAGKSTVLKLISRIIEPTSGDVEIHGRVGALLELGAGFHPDLSGRENIYLNGSILGLSRGEIHEKVEQIVDFSELARFIDMPIRHYSSGMSMRLGFSVAAHLDPEILLVDEVLAVGDESFQNKCLERIRTMQRDGVSIVLVSHNLEEIIDTCDRAIWIEHGQVAARGLPPKVVKEYLTESASGEQARRTASLLAQPDDSPSDEESNEERAAEEGTSDRRWGDGRIVVTDVRLLDEDHQPSSKFHPDRPLHIELDYEVRQPVEDSPAFGIAIHRMDGVWCYGTNTALDGVEFFRLPLLRHGTIIVDIPLLQLLRGEYTLDVAIHDRGGDVIYDYVKGILSFTVRSSRGDQGVFRPRLRWSLS